MDLLKKIFNAGVVGAGARIAEESGMLVNKVVIPSPSKELVDELM